jgi:hypothetical protein
MWLEPMNKLFPRMTSLAILSTTSEEMSLVLPETFQAPDLRGLSLRGIGLPNRLSLLSSMTALSTLFLTDIGASCYFPPGHLVTQLQGLPRLKELSIGFAVPIPLPSSEEELLPAPIPPVTLPSLRELTFRGVGVYLENLMAHINTLLLEQLGLTLLFDLTFTFVNLTEFIHRTEGFECPAAQVIFKKGGVSIKVGDHGRLVTERLSLSIHCEPLDWQINSATQVSIALENVLTAVEELTLGVDVDGMPSDWENGLDDLVDDVLWHELLLPFISVKVLYIRPSLTLQLSQALQSVAGELVLELLPELQELQVPALPHVIPQNNLAQNHLFSAFVETRESVGRPVRLINIQKDWTRRRF